MDAPKRTDYGFQWGAADVKCLFSDDKHGSIVMELTTPRYPNGLQIYVTKTGLVRVIDSKGEWKRKETR